MWFRVKRKKALTDCSRETTPFAVIRVISSVRRNLETMRVPPRYTLRSYFSPFFEIYGVPLNFIDIRVNDITFERNLDLFFCYFLFLIIMATSGKQKIRNNNSLNTLWLLSRRFMETITYSSIKNHNKLNNYAIARMYIRD